MAGTKTSDPEWMVHWLFGPTVKDYDDPHRHGVFKFIITIGVMRRIREPRVHAGRARPEWGVGGGCHMPLAAQRS